MKFEKFELLNYKKHLKGCNIKLIDDFIKSGLKCAKVTEWNTKNSQYCASSIQLTIKKYRQEYKNILCIHRRGEVFLINEAVD